MRTVLHAAAALVVVAVCGCGTGGAPAAATPIHIGTFSSWAGYGILQVGAQKGYFRTRGLDVQLSDVESTSAAITALNAGHLDGVTSTVQNLSRFRAQGTPVTVVLPMDNSYGGDGILAIPSITTVAQLRGQMVGVAQATTSEWLLAQVLASAGLSLSDVHEVNMSASDASAAFLAHQIPVAVSAEPYLTRASSSAAGHVLVSTRQFPDLLDDALGLRSDLVTSKRGAIAQFVQGYYDAFAWYTSHTGEGNQIIATAARESVADVATNMTQLQLYDIHRAKTFCGTSAQPGPIFQVADQAMAFWKSIGQVKSTVSAQQFIDPSFVSAAQG